MSTDLSDALRTSAGHEPAFSALLGNMLVIMSADSTVGNLAHNLAANPNKTDVSLFSDPQTANPGVKIKFHAYDGEEQLSVSLKHSEKSDRIFVQIQTSSNFLERREIGQLITSILKNATNKEINFSKLERAINAGANVTNTRAINVRQQYDIPAGLNTRITPKASQIVSRQNQASQTYMNVLDSILAKLRTSQGHRERGFKPAQKG